MGGHNRALWWAGALCVAICIPPSSFCISLPESNVSASPQDSAQPGARGFTLDEASSCNIETIETANSDQLFSILDELVNTTYFRIFRVDLNRTCFRDAAVRPKCTAGDPALDNDMFGAASTFTATAKPPEKCSVATEKDTVDKTLSAFEEQTTSKIEHKSYCDPELPEFWLDMCSHIPAGTSHEYVNLILNPETWTGYNGSVVWSNIYADFHASDLSKMTYEQRVLYRLLSGMHTSINIHISNAFYPPSKARGNNNYVPNPTRFMEQYATKPQYVRDLHFAFVVVLRALTKAAPVLRHVSFDHGDSYENERGRVLLNRLLDSPIMQSCRPVFNMFDESLMFKEKDTHVLKKQFKAVFKNVSDELDCVTCQRCKLHGKLFLLGLGTALKTLLIPEPLRLSLPLTREETVALINTAGKLSSSIRYIDKLQKEYARTVGAEAEKEKKRAEKKAKAAKQEETKPNVPPVPPSNDSGDVTVSFDVMDNCVGKVAKHLHQTEHHDAVLDRVLNKDIALLVLARHYDGNEFKRHVVRHVTSTPAPSATPVAKRYDYDVVVVGGGLAGMSAALSLLDSGLRVCLLEKEGFVGGNSALASSGINGVNETLGIVQDGDSLATFRSDVLASSGLDEIAPLAGVLVNRSGAAVDYVIGRARLPLDKVVQMGGHSFPRTYRPSKGMAGAEIVMAMNLEIGKYEKAGAFKMLKRTRATSLVYENNAVGGINIEGVKDKKVASLTTQNVVLASGGFAIGRQEGTMLAEVRPDLNKFATTNGKWCTGDGHKMAKAVGADTVDIGNIQIHPTGFIDPKHPDHATKTLCAELLRGMGAVLLLRNGSRFANELGTRRYLSNRMVEEDPEKLEFTIVVHEAAAVQADKHIPLYEQKKLLKREDTLASLAEHLGLDAEQLADEFKLYNSHAKAGADPYGKEHFNNAPIDLNGYFYVGKVTPVLHYTMGGLKVDTQARVLSKDGEAIKGLYAAGEIVGGVHGNNRLGGNALTECVVFGMVAADSIVRDTSAAPQASDATADEPADAEDDATKLREITMEEVRTHATAEDCWVVIHGMVYDLSEFVEEHPAGPEAIFQLAGKDGTAEFAAAHSESTMAVFTPLGTLKQA